jgi:glycosyltransferase involved in cell wall biosynthesis
MKLMYSFIIPVYNRPEEVDELLASLANQSFESDFEVVIVEDGSTINAKEIIEKYAKQLQISYLEKENSGPGDSRNYGMRHAQGNYFLILDSDCILPTNYLQEVDLALSKEYVHCFGGPDAAHSSFTQLQKAINYSMTSLLTTGGIRGNASSVNKFQPRSFNMGISKEVFQKTAGFGNIHPGEDPDLTLRIWKAGYDTKLLEKAFVYHKRRISWSKFYTQMHKFGLVRPILNSWHPASAKLTYWFPLLFCIGLILSFVMLIFNWWLGLLLYGLYYAMLFVGAAIANKSVYIALLTLVAASLQFIAYGYGFLKTTVAIGLLNKEPETAFPELFFKTKTSA